MNAMLVAVVCALVGAAPILFNRRYAIAGLLAGVYFLAGWPILYLAAPSTVYPLFGGPGILALIYLGITGVADLFASMDDYHGEGKPWALIPPILALVIFALVAVSNCTIFNAKGYASMAGNPEVRIWTQDIQPKDPKHMLMGSIENALYQADKALGQAGAIGSQFQVAKEYITLQRINDQWWYVVPLDYRGFSVWWSSAGVPAYIKVSAEDPNRSPQLVQLKDGAKMKYMPGAFFGSYLTRHMRYSGYLNRGLYEFLFEIDEEGNPWWVVPLFKPEYGWWGERLTGVALVNPISGETKTLAMEEIPAWMDRVFPGELTEKYLTWRGVYHDGWINSWWGKNSLTEPQTPILVYGADSEPYWVSGITSNNAADNSLVALAYTDARLGKCVLYEVQGGATEEAIVDAVNNNEQVSYKKLHGVNPQLYNVYGTMASVVPLLNESRIFQGVAIVDINNTSQIAIGKDQYEARQQYQRLLGKSGQQVALDNTRLTAVLENTVARIGVDAKSGVYFLLLDGTPHLFTLDATDRPDLVITKEGDKVRIKYENSGERVMPAVEFENLSVVLQAKPIEQEIKNQAESRKEAEQVRQIAPTIQQNLKKQLDTMSPEELQKLEQQVTKQNKSVAAPLPK